ncbi:MAG TPA: NAD(P)-dependent oxidoreductase, partial [Chitinophagaceae bacterium]
MKAFLGLGLLGSNFVKALLKKGDSFQVWNRTESKAKELEAFGAKSFSMPADAVKGAEIIHLTLKDDESVDDVLSQALPGLSPGAIIIDHTTTSRDGAISRTKYWKDRGFIYQHAPVFMGPANALESSGYMLVSGDQSIIEKIKPELTKMTGELINFGEEIGRAAAMKLIGNSFLVCFTTSIGDSLALAKALGVSSDDVSRLFSSWNPGSQLQSRLKKIADGEFETPSWTLEMARKDTGLFMEAAKKAHVQFTLIPSVASVMDEWIKKGHKSNDWTV